MILLLMRDDKVDDQRALFFAFMSFFFLLISISSHYLHPNVYRMGSVLRLILDLGL
jgi:hypothetical protein